VLFHKTKHHDRKSGKCEIEEHEEETIKESLQSKTEPTNSKNNHLHLNIQTDIATVRLQPLL